MITGLHHVTVIAGDPGENLAFYTRVLGMRLVKRTVNQDRPGTYHLFYADAVGHAGTDLTFFPWPDHPAKLEGHGLTSETTLAVPAGTLDWWHARLHEAGVAVDGIATRFGERVLSFADPHGVALALAELREDDAARDARAFTPWADGPVPASHQIRGLHAVRMVERDLEETARFLVDVMGFARGGVEDGWHRLTIAGGGTGRTVDLCAAPEAPRGKWGVGAVHHVAWRVPDDAAELAVRERAQAAGRRPTEVIDRFWFKSVYFLEPGGALVEIATDGPGFAVDESEETLGASLVLPPWLEERRGEIEGALPRLSDQR
ncbi:MAG: ring-cleaving dioxygenase [Gemmatirosa sp.]